jgi:hypothetical protein
MAQTVVDKGHTNSPDVNQIFWQYGGSQFANCPTQLGSDLLSIAGGETSDGDIEREYIRYGGNWHVLTETINPPDDGETEVTINPKAGTLARLVADPSCEHTMYHAFVDDCGVLKRVVVYPDMRRQTVDEGDIYNAREPETMEQTVTYSRAGTYPIATVNLGRVADTEIVDGVADVVYAGGANCGDCGAANDGSKTWYAVTASEVIYRVAGKENVQQATVNGIQVGDTLNSIAVFGSRLVVGFSNGTNGGVFYATLGADGSVGSFTRLLLTSTVINDIEVDGAGRLWLVASGGKAGYTTSITTLVAGDLKATGVSTDLLRVKAYGNSVVIVGNDLTVLRATDSSSFATTSFTNVKGTAPVSTDDVRAVAIRDRNTVVVGTSAGRVYATAFVQTSAPQWYEIDIPNAGTSQINDIAYGTNEVMYIAHGAKIYRNVASGSSCGVSSLAWGESTFMTGYDGTAVSILRIATPDSGSKFVRGNNVIAGGVATGGTDGILLVGEPAIS